MKSESKYKISIHKNAFENIVYQMAVIMFTENELIEFDIS